MERDYVSYLVKRPMNIKLTIKYNGTRYQGWQRLGGEDSALTIQGILEEKAGELLGEKVALIGSGRTDAGVHAYGQVANFHTKKKIDCHAFLSEMNQRLPRDIQIVLAEPVSEEFHSRYSAVSKTYEYHIAAGDTPNVFARETSLLITEPLDLAAMRKAATFLVGTHDYAGFASKMPDKRPTVKTISDIQIRKEDTLLIITYEGDGFLYNMVRIMTGTLLEVGVGKRSPESIQEVLRTKNRQLAGKTVEGKGLFLSKAVYL